MRYVMVKQETHPSGQQLINIYSQYSKGVTPWNKTMAAGIKYIHMT